MAQLVRRSLGLGFGGTPIHTPEGECSLLVAPASKGKTAAVAVPFLQSMTAGRATDDQHEKEGMR